MGFRRFRRHVVIGVVCCALAEGRLWHRGSREQHGLDWVWLDHWPVVK